MSCVAGDRRMPELFLVFGLNYAQCQEAYCTYRQRSSITRVVVREVVPQFFEHSPRV